MREPCLEAKKRKGSSGTAVSDEVDAKLDDTPDLTTLGKKKKKKKKKTSKKKKDSTSSSSAESSSTDDDLVFQKASSAGLSNPILKESTKHPGALLRSGIKTMQGYMAPVAGASWRGGDKTTGLEPRAVEYLTTVLQANKGVEISPRNLREMRTCAEAIDCILSGKIAETGDILMQRLKALELQATGMPWSAAAKLEIVPEAGATAVSNAEREVIANLLLREQKLYPATGPLPPGPVRRYDSNDRFRGRQERRNQRAQEHQRTVNLTREEDSEGSAPDGRRISDRSPTPVRTRSTSKSPEKRVNFRDDPVNQGRRELPWRKRGSGRSGGRGILRNNGRGGRRGRR